MVKRVGVIGGGQLAWMMATAAEKLGIELLVQTPSVTDPAVAIAGSAIFAPIADAAATAQLAMQSDVITFENEFVDLDALEQLVSQGVCFRPGLQSLKPLLDKYHQRSYLRDLGLPTPQFAAVELPLALTPPLVLKTRRHGYDGQGTFIVKTLQELETTLAKLQNVPLIAEELILFERELAAIAARSINGEIALYPIVETYQEQQVCRRVIAPARVSATVEAQVEAIVQTLLTSLDVVGVFGIELFLTPNQKVLVNEIAPRVHNSGHFTLDACVTSQFEQHLRAVGGLPLGDPTMHTPAAVMVNLLGYEQSDCDYGQERQQLAALPDTYVHWYGKTESRVGRKLGHVTTLLQDGQTAAAIAQQIEHIWYGKAEE